MPKPSQNSAMPSTPRTPTSKVLGARQSTRAAVEDFNISTPGAPRTPTRPLILHDPTSPTPMPMLRSRRGHTIPPFAQSIMGHGGRGSESDQSSDNNNPKRNGVSVHEEIDLKMRTRRQSSSINSNQTPPRLIVSIPITAQNKRPSDGDLGNVSEDRKHRRLSDNSRSKDISSIEPSSTEQSGNNEDSNRTSEMAVDRGEQSVKEHHTSNQTSVRTTRSRTAEMRTKLIQEHDNEKEGLDEIIVDSQPGPEPPAPITDCQEIEVEDQPELDVPQVDDEPLEDTEDPENMELNDVDSDVEDGEDPALVPEKIKKEIEEFEQGFNGLQGKFKLLDKIGEGTFSSVYRAIDLEYDLYDNSNWEYEIGEQPSQSKSGSEEVTETAGNKDITKKTSGSETEKIVAIKRIYVTSSPRRIENEINILHALSGHKNVIPLITAFRFKDQVVAVLPYFEHSEFEKYFRSLPMDDIRCYFRSLLSGLVHVHRFGVIHRDIKPSNFLFNMANKTGVIVDFGLAQRQKHAKPSGRSLRLKAAAGKQIAPSSTPSISEKPINDSIGLMNKQATSSKLDTIPDSKATTDITAPNATPMTKDTWTKNDNPLKNEQILQSKLSTQQLSMRKYGQERSMLASSPSTPAPAPTTVTASAHPSNSSIKYKNDLFQSNRPDIASYRVRRFDGNPVGPNSTAVPPAQTLGRIESRSSKSKLDLLHGKRDPTQIRRKFEGPPSNVTVTGSLQPTGSITSISASTTRQANSNSNLTTPATPNPLTQRTSTQHIATPYGSPLPPMSNLTSQSRMKAMLATQHAIPGNSQLGAMTNKREPGYFKKDPRPEIHVNRAGTRGFRAPEVLFRHTQQTTALDIWAVGVILATFLTGRYPFFNCHDDADSLLEIAIVAGKIEMRKAAASFNRTFVTNIPTIRDKGLPMVKLCRVVHPERFNPPEGYSFTNKKTSNPPRQPGEKTLDSTKSANSYTSVNSAKSSELPSKINLESTHVHQEKYSGSQKSLVDTVGDIEIVDDIDMAIADEDQSRANAEAESNGEGSSNNTKPNSHKRVVGWDSQEGLIQAVSLLERLLDVNPKTRITASQALKHPFLAEKQLTP
ncbi:hypothetical protein BGZ76_004949 [Entomortierella beljakovae]|nr:hypothetical protein BGZ76_004949 [Entomortierella beljakovae]